MEGTCRSCGIEADMVGPPVTLPVAFGLVAGDDFNEMMDLVRQFPIKPRCQRLQPSDWDVEEVH
jgi:hypothetical protein